MIRSAAVVPCPPLLVTHLAGGGSDAPTDALRAACHRAAHALPRHRWHVVGVDAAGPATFASGATGDFRGYGLDVDVRLGAEGRDAAHGLPLALLVAAWLAGEAGVEHVDGQVVAPGTPLDDCLELGRAVAALPDDTGLLIVGDGSRLHDAPGAGRVDPRAARFDDGVAAALAAGDPDALAAVDAGTAAELDADGRAAWHVLAGAARGRRWRGELLWSAAPYGVRYHVAGWRAAP